MGVGFALSLLRRRGGARPARGCRLLSIAGIWTQARWTGGDGGLGAPDWALGVTVGGVLAAAAVGANIAAIRSRPWLAPLSVAALNLCAPALISEATPLPLPAAIALCALILALAGLPLAGPWLTLLEQAGTRSATTAVISAESLGAMIAGVTVPGLISAIGLSGLGWAAALCWCFAVASATWQRETTPTRAP